MSETATQPIRANKVTAQFEGEGVIVGTFYRTHDKLGQVRSTDAAVITAGFVMPESVPASEGVDPVEVTPSQKLEAFKEFLKQNSGIFGFSFDPVDRRPDANKYPSRYTPEVLLETANKVLVEGLQKLVESAQKHIDSLVKNGAMPQGTALGCSIGIGDVKVSENYKNGAMKYGDVTFPVTFTVAGSAPLTLNTKVDLVSGQLRKPRQLDDKHVFTVTGLKTALVEAGLIVKPAPKEEPADAEAPVQEPAVAQ